MSRGMRISANPILLIFSDLHYFFYYSYQQKSIAQRVNIIKEY